ncbi:TraR/DksA family transcriptional regulator [Microbacterium sp. ZW T5_56]|uniref:TraR/DksA family transcriptional regulator n=1 Tax=Microbacterium sp. ZW T5_56 TaxID=3378081 RepID=UPI003852BD1B
MVNRDLSRAVTVLAARRAAAQARATAAADQLAHVGAMRDSAGGDDEHDPEGVPLSEEWSRLDARRAAAEQELREIAAAEARVSDGRYGVCADCGEQIPLARLEALPFALRCVPCAEKRGSR